VTKEGVLDMQENYIQRLTHSSRAYQTQHATRGEQPQAYYFGDPDSEDEAEEPGPDPHPLDVIEEDKPAEENPEKGGPIKSRGRARGPKPTAESPQPMEAQAEADIPAQEGQNLEMDSQGSTSEEELEMESDKTEGEQPEKPLPPMVGCQKWIRELEEGPPATEVGDAPTRSFASKFTTWYNTHSKSVYSDPSEKIQKKVVHHLWIIYRVQFKDLGGGQIGPAPTLTDFFAIMGSHHYHFAVVAFCLQHGPHRIHPTAPEGAILVPPGNVYDKVYMDLIQHVDSEVSPLAPTSDWTDTDLMNVLYWMMVIDSTDEKQMAKKAVETYNEGHLDTLLTHCLNLQYRFQNMGLLGAAG
jgi:hypothetical protein